MARSDTAAHVAVALVTSHLLLVLSSIAILAAAASGFRAPKYARTLNYLRIVKAANLPSYNTYVTTEGLRARAAIREYVERELAKRGGHARSIDVPGMVTPMVLDADDWIFQLEWPDSRWVTTLCSVSDYDLTNALAGALRAAHTLKLSATDLHITLDHRFPRSDVALSVSTLNAQHSFFLTNLQCTCHQERPLREWLQLSEAGRVFAMTDLPTDARAIWLEIGDKTLDEAIQYLEKHTSDAGNLPVAGLNLALIANPFTLQVVTASLLLYFLANLLQLKQAGSVDPGIWIGCYSNVVARFLTLISIAGLPVASNIAYLASTFAGYRLARPTIGGRALEVLGIFIIGILATITTAYWLRLRRALRRSLRPGRFRHLRNLRA